MTESLEWKVHTPNLLREVLENPGTSALRIPLNIFGKLLAEVGERAAEINDPKLNELMLRLAIYEQGDPEIYTFDQISKFLSEQHAAIAKAEGRS